MRHQRLQATTLAALALALLVGGCTGLRRLDDTGIPRVAAARLDGDPSLLRSALEDGATGVILEIPGGWSLPLTLTATTPIVALEPGRNRIRFERDMLLYLSSSEVLLSPDGTEWAPVHDTDALGRLFGFESGTFSIGLGTSKERGAEMALSLATE